MKASIFVPEQIRVGFQNRSDTYTKKLAYVIYYDEKGKLRKETSWNSWRDDKIEPITCDNIPTSGFVLNKKVGDYVSDWNHRQAYVRVYDPRDFEFEITIENLLYILENASSIKGKGLEGDFVYGWDGKDLIIIPTASPDYSEISKYNEVVHNNNYIKAKDLIIGVTYLTKENSKLVYMGKFDCYDYVYRTWVKGEYCYHQKYRSLPYDSNNRRLEYDYIQHNSGEQFFFAEQEDTYTYQNGEEIITGNKYVFNHFKSISKKLIGIENSECIFNYAEIFNELENNKYYSPVDDSKDKYIPYTYEEFVEYMNQGWWHYVFTEECNNKRYSYELRKNNDNLFIINSTDKDLNKRFRQEEYDYSCGYGWNKTVEKRTKMIPITIDELYERLQPCYLNKYLANGIFYERRNKN